LLECSLVLLDQSPLTPGDSRS